jgi:hypothetical protein
VADAGDLLFEITTPLGFSVRLTTAVWKAICDFKHPVMLAREQDLANALNDPVEIRRSRVDTHVYLFYRVERPGRWLCVIAKHLDGDGFVITAYPTDAVKIGEQIWTK